MIKSDALPFWLSMLHHAAVVVHAQLRTTKRDRVRTPASMQILTLRIPASLAQRPGSLLSRDPQDVSRLKDYNPTRVKPYVCIRAQWDSWHSVSSATPTSLKSTQVLPCLGPFVWIWDIFSSTRSRQVLTFGSSVWPNGCERIIFSSCLLSYEPATTNCPLDYFRLLFTIGTFSFDGCLSFACTQPEGNVFQPIWLSHRISAQSYPSRSKWPWIERRQLPPAVKTDCL